MNAPRHPQRSSDTEYVDVLIVGAGLSGRSQADAPKIDGHVYLRDVWATLKQGDIFDCVIQNADEHDLFGAIA